MELRCSIFCGDGFVGPQKERKTTELRETVRNVFMLKSFAFGRFSETLNSQQEGSGKEKKKDRMRREREREGEGRGNKLNTQNIAKCSSIMEDCYRSSSYMINICMSLMDATGCKHFQSFVTFYLNLERFIPGYRSLQLQRIFYKAQNKINIVPHQAVSTGIQDARTSIKIYRVKGPEPHL